MYSNNYERSTYTPDPSSVADAYYEERNAAENERKVMTLESNVHNTSFSSTESFASNTSLSNNTENNQGEILVPQSTYDSAASQMSSDTKVFAIDSSKTLTNNISRNIQINSNGGLSTVNGEDSLSMAKIFPSDMQNDMETDNVDHDLRFNTNNVQEIERGTIIKSEIPMNPTNPSKVFTVDSMVNEPVNGLQKSNNGNWLCDICGHQELLKDDLLTHRILHLSDDHSKQCPICEKKFSSSTSLRNHLTVHTGIKKFRCKYCGRKFGWKTQLAIHENLHTGKGLHHCNICTKSFMTKWLLQRHLKIHLKDKRRAVEGNNNNNITWNHTGLDPSNHSQRKYELLQDISGNGSTIMVGSTSEAKGPKCNECNQIFKTQDVLALHLLQHNTAKQNNIRHKSSNDDEMPEQNNDTAGDNWSAHGEEMSSSEQTKLNKTPIKGSLTSIVTKLHHKVDEKQQKYDDEATEVLILGESENNTDKNHYLKDQNDTNHVLKEGGVVIAHDYKLTDSLSNKDEKQPMSSSVDPFISGINEVRRDTASLMTYNTSSNMNRNNDTLNRSTIHPASDITASSINDLPVLTHNKEVRDYLIKQEKEIISLQNMVSSLHGKLDSLTNIVTSQSLLINRMFLGGKMVVSGLLDFNVRNNNIDISNLNSNINNSNEQSGVGTID